MKYVNLLFIHISYIFFSNCNVFENRWAQGQGQFFTKSPADVVTSQLANGPTRRHQLADV